VLINYQDALLVDLIASVFAAAGPAKADESSDTTLQYEQILYVLGD
jgi:hypothetical protein